MESRQLRTILLVIALQMLLNGCRGASAVPTPASEQHERRLHGMMTGGSHFRRWDSKIISSQVHTQKSIEAAVSSSKGKATDDVSAAKDASGTGSSEIRDMLARSPNPYKPELDQFREHANMGRRRLA